MHITTNHQWRDFTYRTDVPAHVLTDQFDWLDSETSDGFFQYRGCWYHLTEFTVAPASLTPWDGYKGDSYSSGILIQVSRDGEQYRIATYYS